MPILSQKVGQNLRHIRKVFHPRRGPAGGRCGTRNDGQGIGSLVSACRLGSPLGPTKRYRIWRLHLLNRLAIRRRREPQRPTEQAVHVALVRKPAVGGDALERNVLAGEPAVWRALRAVSG